MSNTRDLDVQKAAEERILATRDRLLAEQKAVRVERQRLSELERDVERRLSDCLAAARFFGIEIVLPVDEEAIADLQRRVRTYEIRMRASETEEDKNRAFELLSRLRIQLADMMARRNAEQNGSTSGQEAMELGVPDVAPSPMDGSVEKTPRVREITLDRLQAAGSNGQRASDIRSFIQQSYPVTLHEKTVGMTLYRLSQDKLAHRRGQRWFYGPQEGHTSSASTENPGASTPGPTHDAE